MKIPPSPWHDRSYPDNLKKAGYLEWKYFNFSSPGLSGIFVYLIADPLNLTGIGGGRVIGRLFAGNKIFGGVNHFPKDATVLHSKTEIGKNNRVEIFSKFYKITGHGDEISWNLKFHPLLPQIKGFSDLSLDFLNLEKAWWEVKMPKARVEGTVKVGRKSFRVKSFGYADTNWGNVFPLTTKINWAQYNDKKISVIFGEMDSIEIGGKKIGRWARTYVTVNGKKIVFPAGSVSIQRADWKKIRGTRISVPTITIIHAQNRRFSLVLRATAFASDPIRFQMPFFIPLRPVIVEQPAFFAGDLMEKTGNGMKSIHKIDGKGFTEYTLRDMEFSAKRPKAGVLV